MINRDFHIIFGVKTIEVAKQAGVAVKSAKRRLAQLEEEAQARFEESSKYSCCVLHCASDGLQAVLASESPSVSAVRAAIDRAKAHSINVKTAELLMQSLLQKQECNKELESAMQQKKEDRLAAAIEHAKRLGNNTVSFQAKLGPHLKIRCRDGSG